jgi:hypothetical protein
MNDVPSAGERLQHALGVACIPRFPKRHAVEIDDGIGRDDQCFGLASANRGSFRSRVPCREFARSIAGPVSFVDIARKNAYVQAERGE